MKLSATERAKLAERLLDVVPIMSADEQAKLACSLDEIDRGRVVDAKDVIAKLGAP